MSRAGSPSKSRQFSDESLAAAKFANVDLSAASFTDVGLSRARFNDTNLEDVQIENSNLTGVVILDCNLNNFKINGILVSDLLAAFHGSKASPEPSNFSLEKYVNIFDSAIKQLESKTWFKKEGWVGKRSLFPTKSPRLVSIHIHKKHWFNDDGQGIHFETFAGAKEHKSKTVPVMIHLLHSPTIPGTKIKRTVLAKAVVDELYETISNWDGYVFRAGKYGTQPFTHHLDFAEDTLSTGLVTQLSRLCRTIGPIVDRELKRLSEA